MLYADDDQSYASAVKRHLKARLGKDIQLTRVENMYDALEHMKAHPVDVLLSDIKIGQIPMVENLHEIIEKMPRRFASGVEFLAYAQEHYGIHPIALSGARFPPLDNHPGIDFIEKPLLESGYSSYISRTLKRLLRYKNRPASRFRLLLIEPDKAKANATKEQLKTTFGNKIHITRVKSTHAAFDHLDQKQYHAIIADPFQETSDLGFLSNMQHQFQTPVLAHSESAEHESAQRLLRNENIPGYSTSKQGTEKLEEHLGQLLKRFNPIQTGQKIDLDAIAAIGPVLHVTSEGKQELIELVKRDPADVKVEMIRSGKRYPLTTQQKIDALYAEMRGMPKRDQERLLRTIKTLEQTKITK